jgi:hypothetical protein
MRNLALVAVAVAVATGGFIGCGGSTSRKPGETGVAGSGGAAGTTGAAGTNDQAGTTGQAGEIAGTTGAAGDTSVAGTTGNPDAAAGASGAAGAAGAGQAGVTGAASTPAPYCDATNTKPLPYNVEADFKPTDVLNAHTTWNTIASPNCDQTVFPPLTPPTDGGADGSSDGSTDSATEAGASDAGVDGGDGSTATLELTDPDAGDAGDASAADGGASDGHADAVPDAATDAPADVPVDAPVGDAVATADAAPLPACYEFTYDPDACVAANGGVAANAIATCYSGTIFVTNMLNAADVGPGICIASGATKVTFMARASRDGARIKFGSTREGLNTTEVFLTLTTSWATYSVPQPDDYLNSAADIGNPGGVWNGFSVVTEPEDHAGGTYIFVKDIQWVAQ